MTTIVNLILSGGSIPFCGEEKRRGKDKLDLDKGVMVIKTDEGVKHRVFYQYRSATSGY